MLVKDSKENSYGTVNILTHTFAWSKKHIRGSIEERYIMYADLAILLRRSFVVSWYSTLDRISCQISESTVICKNLTIFDLMKGILRPLFLRGYHIYIISYPYCFNGWALLRVIVPLLSLVINTVRLFKRNLLVLTDIIDPPIETAISDSDKDLPRLKYIVLRVLDVLFHKMSSNNIVLTNSYKKYFSTLYKINPDKYIIISPPSLCRWIRYIPPKTMNTLRILYSGVCKKERNVDLVIQTIKELQSEGVNVRLMITSPLIVMELPKDIEVNNYPWNDYVEKALTQADICVIPYPSNKIHYLYTLVAKCFDYLSAGKPILSTPLGETAKIIVKNQCGLIFRSKEELKKLIRHLYYNREELIQMSKNAKEASLRYCDSVLSKDLALAILARLKTLQRY